MTAKAEINDTENSVPTVWRTASPLFAPLNWATRTLPPIVTPVQMELMIKQSIAALLMADQASAADKMPDNRHIREVIASL